RDFTAVLGIVLMPWIFSVIGDQPSSPTLAGVSARNTVPRTVPGYYAGINLPDERKLELERLHTG
ncbi:MAG: hypothetical protein KBB39_12645, partial [Phycicoccus sp.]|nr:hypothetical protein [Phycicoccus sp.]